MMKPVSGIAALALIALSGCQQPAQPSTSATASPPAVTTPALPGAAAPAAPPPAAVSLGSSEDAKSEVKLDVVEATRAGGVVTMRVRLTLIGGKSGGRPIPGSTYSGIYLSAADKKYMLLKDDADKELMSTNYYPDFAQIGATSTWWGKFPAPAAEVKAINFYFNDFAPVENVALTDR